MSTTPESVPPQDETTLGTCRVVGPYGTAELPCLPTPVPGLVIAGPDEDGSWALVHLRSGLSVHGVYANPEQVGGLLQAITEHLPHFDWTAAGDHIRLMLAADGGRGSLVLAEAASRFGGVCCAPADAIADGVN